MMNCDKEAMEHSCLVIQELGLCKGCMNCPINSAIQFMNLPSETNVEINELDCDLDDEEVIKDAVMEFVTDKFGFCIEYCDIDLSEDGIAHVTNIDWDTTD